ncbi:hypothetical protein JB92DRAFT_2833492 [Gautieria morchelliformis]|nr:hypothetical protein JB92DRAFT_2833492 [Gautieria morchelliformis]
MPPKLAKPTKFERLLLGFKSAAFEVLFLPASSVASAPLGAARLSVLFVVSYGFFVRDSLLSSRPPPRRLLTALLIAHALDIPSPIMQNPFAFGIQDRIGQAVKTLAQLSSFEARVIYVNSRTDAHPHTHRAPPPPAAHPPPPHHSAPAALPPFVGVPAHLLPLAPAPTPRTTLPHQPADFRFAPQTPPRASLKVRTNSSS